MANEANTSASAPVNKRVTVQRTKEKILSTSKQPEARSKIHLGKPTTQEKKEIKRATLLSSWVMKKYKMPRKDHGTLFLCWHLPILDIASIFTAVLHLFCDEKSMSKLERDGHLIEKIDIPVRPKELPDDIVEVDFESSHLSKYFSSQAWHHL